MKITRQILMASVVPLVVLPGFIYLKDNACSKLDKIMASGSVCKLKMFVE